VGSLEVLQALFTMREGRLLAELLAAMKQARNGEQASHCCCCCFLCSFW